MRRAINAAALPLHRHSLPQLAADAVALALAYFAAFALRFENGLPFRYAVLRDRTIWWATLAGLLILILLRAYQRAPRFSSHRDYMAIARGILLTTILLVGLIAVVRPVQPEEGHRLVAVSLPDSVTALFFLLALLFLVGWRVLVRTLHERRLLSGVRGGPQGSRTVLIVGAGDGGRLVLREILRNRELGLVPLGFLDDDPRKRGLRIDDVRVRGNTESDLPRILEESEPDEVLIAIPSAPGATRARVVRECRKRSIPVRTLPTVFELLQTRGASPLARQMREVRVEDLLGREPVHMELERVGAYLAGDCVLVTGAGGSIGSELSRQIARVAPRRLVLVDHAEGNLFAIERELVEERHIHPDALAVALADCRDRARMEELFAEHRPGVVFHAAAYKHVGLMEGNPDQAIANNALATGFIAECAGRFGARCFVLVSTDKAVAPATVMGASKMLAELALDLASARHPRTTYKAVRFGNVLGSSGSVVPIFSRQIARGGPVTVTDLRMRRYFMTIPEAVQLIIRAGSLDPTPGEEAAPALGRAAQVLVLDMGEPVRIIELARTMIELSGLEPEKDIEIEVVGRRPGEKLDEQLFNSYEHAQPTPAERLLLARRRPFPAARVEAWLAEIEALAGAGDQAALCNRLFELVRECDELAGAIHLDSLEAPIEHRTEALPR
ncbi:MAG TPA: nucleoside-diphosphate sugar epimerase/dehydratase [Solirubrobacteraceae bacterium]|nr:nucleoside-diphosphate sugar epimerase/dehydratase [Solirubrobacteraceae bacterium]